MKTGTTGPCLPGSGVVVSCIMFRRLIAILVVIHGSAFAEDLPARPNIIWIMCDDLGYGDLGCFGQKTMATPRLDQLAREGMRFTDFYAGCTVCRPSRLSLWTGKHMGHTPISSNANYHFKPEDVTVAELLREAGYRTGGVGKWAMGGVLSRTDLISGWVTSTKERPITTILPTFGATGRGIPWREMCFPIIRLHVEGWPPGRLPGLTR